MKIGEKQERLNYLNRQKALSDDEFEEKLQLEEDLRLLTEKEQFSNPKLEKMSTEPKQEKKSIGQVLFKFIKEKLKEKPVTPEELQELKMQAVKYRLKADIANSKEKIRDHKSKQFEKLLGGFGIDDKRKSEDFRKLFGNTNKRYTK